MTKYFCDGCGKEITPKNQCAGSTASRSRLGTEIKKRGQVLMVEVMTGTSNDIGKTWNNGHWCKHCVLDALYQLDDRKKK